MMNKNFWQNICRIFYDWCSPRLIKRGMYHILSGEYAGAFFVYIKEEDIGNCYALLLMPAPMKAIYVLKNDMIFDLKNENVLYVTKLPESIYDVVMANFVFYANEQGIYANR